MPPLLTDQRDTLVSLLREIDLIACACWGSSLDQVKSCFASIEQRSLELRANDPYVVLEVQRAIVERQVMMALRLPCAADEIAALFKQRIALGCEDPLRMASFVLATLDELRKLGEDELCTASGRAVLDQLKETIARAPELIEALTARLEM